MPRKQRPASILAVAKNILHAGTDSEGMRGLMFRYLEALAIRNYTDGSVEFRAHVLHYFARVYVPFSSEKVEADRSVERARGTGWRRRT